MRLCFGAFVHPFVPAFARSVVYSFIRSFVCSFVFVCYSFVILWACTFVHFCGLLFLSRITCLCEGLFFLSTNSFLALTFYIVYARMMTRTSWMKSLRSLRTPT